MKKIVLTLAFALLSESAMAQIPVIDGANLDVARQNAKNTNSIMD